MVGRTVRTAATAYVRGHLLQNARVPLKFAWYLDSVALLRVFYKNLGGGLVDTTLVS